MKLARYPIFLFLCFLSAFIIRETYAIIDYSFNGIEKNYDLQIAGNLIAYKKYSAQFDYDARSTERADFLNQKPIFRSSLALPANPLILYSFFFVFGESKLAYILILTFYSIISASATYSMFKLAKELFNHKKAIVASAAYALFLPSFYYIAKFDGSAIIPSLSVLMALYSLRAYREANYKNFIKLGLTGGLASMFYGEFFYLTLLLIAFCLYYRKKDSKYGFRFSYGLTGATLGFVVFVVPWCAHNLTITNLPSFNTSLSYSDFWKANNSESTPGEFLKNGKSIRIGYDSLSKLYKLSEEAKIIDSIPFNQRFEVNVDKALLKKGIDNVVANPLQSALRALGRELVFWTFDFFSDKGIFRIINLISILASISFFSYFFKYWKEKISDGKTRIIPYISVFIFFSIYILFSTYKIPIAASAYSFYFPIATIGGIKIYEKLWALRFS